MRLVRSGNDQRRDHPRAARPAHANILTDPKRLAIGGGRSKNLDCGWFVEPTVSGNVDNDSVIAPEEIFGPVPSGPGLEGMVCHASPEQARAFRPYASFVEILEVASADYLGQRGSGQEYRGCRSLLHGFAALSRGFQASGVLLESGGDGAGIDGVGIDAFGDQRRVARAASRSCTVFDSA